MKESAPHGTRTTYRTGCRCLPCKAANAIYEHTRRQRWRDQHPPLGHRISAAQTAKQIQALLIERCTHAQIARALGRRTRTFRLPDRITLRTALKVRRLYRALMLGAEPESRV